jgi:hypothetical protein
MTRRTATSLPIDGLALVCLADQSRQNVTRR